MVDESVHKVYEKCVMTVRHITFLESFKLSF